MSAVERAKEDLGRGDHWLARQRVASYLATSGYDPELLTFLGQICFEMHDAYAAGRYWLASTAEGERVEQAIETFLRHSGGDPMSIAATLPSFVKSAPRGGYPAIVQERLRRIGISDAVSLVQVQRGEDKPRRFRDTLGAVLVGGVMLFGLACLATGLVVIFGWILSLVE